MLSQLWVIFSNDVHSTPEILNVGGGLGQNLPDFCEIRKWVLSVSVLKCYLD